MGSAWKAIKSFRALRSTPAFGRAVAPFGAVYVARVNACPSEFSASMACGGGLVVGDDLAGLGDVFFDELDPVGPVAPGFIGVGNAGGVLTLGLG